MQFGILVVCLLGFGLTTADNLIQLATYYGQNTFVKLVADAGLTKTLSTDGPFTAFVPTDSAFAKLPDAILNQLKNNVTLLTEVLKYHVSPGRVYSSDFLNDLKDPSILRIGEKESVIRINVYPTCATVEGSPVVFRDQNATNGVLHLIDNVMYPIPSRNIPDEIVAQGQRFSTLLTAISKAGLVTALSRGPFTVFAPTNEAFAKLPPQLLSALLANVTLLTDVLTYHVVYGTLFSVGLSKGDMPHTIEGKTLQVDIGADGVYINSAKVVEADVHVTNGVIHAIDTVLLPPNRPSDHLLTKVCSLNVKMYKSH